MATAQSLLRLARSRLGDAYVLGAGVPKGNREWRGPWDCAEFASWCVFQTTGELFGCRPASRGPDLADAWTGWWMEDARRHGKLISVGQAATTPGAFLLRVAEGNSVGHVVISAGNGKTVEAHSTKRGVIEGSSDGRRWHTGVLVPRIDVTQREPEPVRRPGLTLRVRSPLMKGDIVKDVQRALKALGFHSGPTDGVYGPQTAAAVQAFQASKRLVVDGEVGRSTARALGVEWY